MGEMSSRRGLRVVGIVFVLMSVLHLALIAEGLSQSGFISIDCGGVDDKHVDTVTGISYTSDSKIMNFGVRQTVSSNYMTGVSKFLQTLRSFPNGTRNCYNLQPLISDTKYLLRAYFMYGNYDGLETFPQFDFYLGVNFVKTITGTDPNWTFVELMFRATGTTIPVCLVKTTSGVPFMSAVEIRPINLSGYAVVNSSTAIITNQRVDMGRLDGAMTRYPYDAYDRLWLAPISKGLVSINSSFPVTVDNGFNPPSVVMQTAIIDDNATTGLEWDPQTVPMNKYMYMCIHFAELQVLKNNDIRKFNITWNSGEYNVELQPRYLLLNTIFSETAYLPSLSGRNKVSLVPTASSTRSPILNAIELYTVLSLSSASTDANDADALRSITNQLQLSKNWAGDPCLPQGYAWDGLSCSNDSSPRVISLDLSSINLSGGIPEGLAKLSSLLSLNLADNDLTGSIPSFLARLTQLKYLNLSNNNLSGSVPDALLQRNESGSLLLSVSGNQLLCQSKSCQTPTSNKIGLIIGIVIPAFAILVIACAVGIMVSKRKKPSVNKSKLLEKPGGCRIFTYSEVISFTNNFHKKIGEGGYGPVYYGTLDSGQGLAVKILSDKSKQGSKEFQTEVMLLSRIHHKNLVTFIGYCAEAENMILVYEYISNGCLKDILSGRTPPCLDWKMRLQVACDAAQGLDYLHSGCKPGIIHRDVKSANILLDEKLEAKIADFGMSKSGFADGVTHISTAVVGTPGYLDPEYYLTNHLNEKSDVYGFGIVLFEIISGIQPIIIEPSGERIHIVNWIRPQIMKGDLGAVADHKLSGNYETSSMWKIAETALECTEAKATKRPTMGKVVSDLKEAIVLCNTANGMNDAGTGHGFTSEIEPLSRGYSNSSRFTQERFTELSEAPAAR